MIVHECGKKPLFIWKQVAQENSLNEKCMKIHIIRIILYIYHVKKCGKRLLIEASVPKVQVALFIVKRVLLSMCLHIPEGYV